MMVKERKGASASRLRQQEDWKAAQKKAAQVTSQADLRCMAFTDVDVSLTGEAAKAAAAADAAQAAADSAAGLHNGVANGTTSNGKSAEAAPAAAAAAAPAAEASAPTSAADAAAADDNGVVEVKVVSASDWSEAQELALLSALRATGKEVKDRWDVIAALVPDKNKVQCQKRFRELREMLRQ